MTNISRKTGKLALEWSGRAFELQVLKSAAGYYLGTKDETGAPYSRESEEYWKTREAAKQALNATKPITWTQRLRP